MTPKQLEKVVHREPFHPYRLVLVDGEEVVVRRPRKSHVSGDTVALVGECRRPNGAAVERFRMIRAKQIKIAELLAIAPN